MRNKAIFRKYRKGVSRAVGAGVLLPGLMPFSCAVAQLSPAEVYELNLADLLEVEIAVSAVTRHAQMLGDISAAIYVITAEDIRNSSALDLPDLLRMVPGVDVAQLDSSKWAISARGFNSRLASKLLLIIDGRTVYSSSFAAVLWESEDIPLENIESIEVIRGPGATIWGANAVNGVISITTKSAASEMGSLLSLHAGNRYRRNAYFRQGSSIGGNSSFRLFGNVKSLSDSPISGGGSAQDDWDSERMGFRFDSNPTINDSLSLQGNWYDQELSQGLAAIVTPTFKGANILDRSDQSGANVLAKWQHSYQEGESLTTQFFYDLKKRSELLFQESVTTVDLDAFYNNSLSSHDLTLGVGMRLIRHDSTPTHVVRYIPEDETLEIYNVSLYDDITLTDSSILGLGLKIENNIYTGTEYQANLRLNQTLGEGHRLWGAISRAVRTPSRAERSSNVILGYLPPGSEPGQFLDAYLRTQPSENFGTESLHSLELGWRFRHPSGWSVDIASFFNRYSGLRNAEPGQPRCAPNPLCSPNSEHIDIPLTLINADDADSYGAEALVQWQHGEDLSIEASYSLMDISYNSGSEGLVQDIDGLTPNRDNPLRKAILTANWKLDESKTLNLSYRYVGKPGIMNIPSYQAVDVKFHWILNPRITVSLMARNLGTGMHREFHDPLVLPAQALSGSNYAYAMVERTFHMGVSIEW